MSADVGTEHLVSAEWLKEHLGDVLVVDTRWSLQGPSGGEAYAAGHIPGAHFVDLDGELSDPPEQGPGRHPLPSPRRFADALARAGYAIGEQVVAYDDMGGAIAARFWWLMRYFGLGGCAVLDGGIQAWQAAGGALSTDEPTVVSGAGIELRPRPELIADAARVDALRSDDRALIIDARSRERYRGDEEPIDPRPGHIPGAVHAAFADNLEDGYLRDIDELRERYEALRATDADPVVAYCGSGVTACHTLLALSLLGRDDALLYPGSWSDWSSDPNRPAATGDEP